MAEEEKQEKVKKPRAERAAKGSAPKKKEQLADKARPPARL